MYYAAKARAPSARSIRDAVLTPELVALWEDNYRVYGVRKLWKAARRAGIEIGRDQTAGEDNQTRSGLSAASRPGEARVHRGRAEPAVGHGSHVRADLGGGRLRLLHHRRVQPDDRGVAVHVTHAHRDGPRRDRDGPLVEGPSSRGSAMSQRRRVSIHVDSLRGTPRGNRGNAFDRNRRRFV